MAAPASAAVSVMLAVHEKRSGSTVEMYRPLRQFIAQHYSEREAQNLEDDLETVRQMRAQIEKAPESLHARRDLLQAYYKALCVMESRFPISPDKENISSITFVWQDAFKHNKKASQQNIHLEKAAILFNLGAIYSQIALSADRTTATGLKLACNSFQLSAGTFSFLRDHESTKVAVMNPTTLDLSSECASMLEKLMLAQAQECFFEKVIADGKPSLLCAKVARQVSLYYEEAYASLNISPLNQHFDRAWVSHVQLKAALFFAEASYRFSLDLHEREEVAEEIARLKSGISGLSDAKRSAKGVAAPLLDAISKMESNMNHCLERAQKENDKVYLMRVPAGNSLPPLPNASLVKSTPMDEVLDATRERMFSSLVPDSSAKALSRYTEMVDDIIRTQAEKLQQGSEITRVRLKEMDLPDSILALEGNFTLPVDLKEDVESVLVSGGPAGLEAELQQLKDLKRVNQELLVQTDELLQKEAREDAQFRGQFGTRWTRPQSSTLTKNLQDRLNRFAGNLKQAAESDTRIERAVREHAALMSILDRCPIESALPNLGKPMLSLDGNEDAIIGALKQSLRKLETVGAQRAALEDMLKEMKRKDDILPKLMANAGSLEDLFKKEIAKYDSVCEGISKNIEAQQQLLEQIHAQNDEFAAIFNLEDYKAAREKGYKQIAAAISKFREIKDNINEGLKFYVTLQEAITNIKQQCSDFVMTRNIQCQEMIDDIRKQLSRISIGDVQSRAYNPQGHPTSVDAQGAQYSLHYEGRGQSATGLPIHGQSPYASSHLQPPYHVLPGSGNQHHMTQQPVAHEYFQPSYSGWRGPYYSAQVQQPGTQPPYAVPTTYPPHPGFYKPQ